jgi:hypothetical protein
MRPTSARQQLRTCIGRAALRRHEIVITKTPDLLYHAPITIRLTARRDQREMAMRPNAPAFHNRCSTTSNVCVQLRRTIQQRYRISLLTPIGPGGRLKQCQQKKRLADQSFARFLAFHQRSMVGGPAMALAVAAEAAQSIGDPENSGRPVEQQ